MGKNIVLCADGTGNTFDKRTTNVSRMIFYLALDNSKTQVVVYDQGVGTRAHAETVHKYSDTLELPDSDAFQVTSAPARSGHLTAGVNLARGLLFGYGLTENVRQLYEKLWKLYDVDDHVFLFGFSRGAFTVRALAGLLYRCQLPPPDCAEFDARFQQAWNLFMPSVEDKAATATFREAQRPCPIHFIGVWDTVKSYGGLRPVALPHLRHNPTVDHIRHALALDEERAWFKATTWGRLDQDRCGAMTKLTLQERRRVDAQDIQEVWFAGSHSDVGGDGDLLPTARIVLRWMLAGAAGMEPGLRLNAAGDRLLRTPDPRIAPRTSSSQNAAWWLAEHVPRQEIDNSGVYPRKRWAWGSSGKRRPCNVPRDRRVYLHPTAAERVTSIPCAIVMPPEQPPPLGPYPRPTK